MALLSVHPAEITVEAPFPYPHPMPHTGLHQQVHTVTLTHPNIKPLHHCQQVPLLVKLLLPGPPVPPSGHSQASSQSILGKQQ
jgi:hypothetical protein